MGYTTDFTGEFTITPPLDADQVAYLRAFQSTRRMRRDAKKLKRVPDPLREAVGLSIGKEGEYFVGGKGEFGQEQDFTVLDHNKTPGTQPGLWCQWQVSKDGKELAWDQAEKFYNYIEWLEYMVEHFFRPWGRKIDGIVRWQGEDPDDAGVIKATQNVIESARNIVMNPLTDGWINKERGEL